MSSQYDRERRAERVEHNRNERTEARGLPRAPFNNVDIILEKGRHTARRDSKALRYFYQSEEQQ